MGVALWSPRGPDANFDECLGKSKETDAQPNAPETQLTREIRLHATKKQRTGDAQATAKQPPSNAQASTSRTPTPPKDSSKEESKQESKI